MKKQKVLRKLKKVYMFEPSTVTSAPPSLAAVTVSKPRYRSFIGRILQSITAALLNPAKSNLARAVLAPSTPKTTLVGPADEKKIKVHASYVAFCAAVGVEPRTIEDWDEQREQQNPTTSKIDALLHTKQPREFTIDSLIVSRKTKQYLENLIATGKHSEAQRFLPSLVRVTVAVRDTALIDPKDSFTKRGVFRIVSVSEDRSGYVWQNRSRASEIVPTIEPACFRRVERPVTFDKHVAQSVSSYRLFRKNGTPRNVERPISVDLATMQITPEWVESFVIKIDTLKPSTKERKLPFRSKWCDGCKEHVEQWHACQGSDAHLQHWQYYKNARALHASRRLDPEWSENKRRRKQAWEQRKRGYYERYRLLFADNLRLSPRASSFKHSQLAKAAHEVFWADSFGTLFTHMLGRVTSLADRVVVHDLREINSWVPPITKPSLSAAKPLPCKHLHKRAFTFKAGETITACPDCTLFDEKREEILKIENIFKADPSWQAFYDAALNAAGLSMGGAAFPKQLVWGDSIDLGNVRDVEGEDSFNHSGVKTAGFVGTDQDGLGKDSSVRDRRANTIRRKEAKHVPLTNSLCWWCGAELWDRKGTHFCPDTDHRQRFDEEVEELICALQKLPVL